MYCGSCPIEITGKEMRCPRAIHGSGAGDVVSPNGLLFYSVVRDVAEWGKMSYMHHRGGSAA